MMVLCISISFEAGPLKKSVSNGNHKVRSFSCYPYPAIWSTSAINGVS